MKKMDMDEIEIEIVLDDVELEELMKDESLTNDSCDDDDDDDDEEDFMSLYDDPYALLLFEED